MLPPSNKSKVIRTPPESQKRSPCSLGDSSEILFSINKSLSRVSQVENKFYNHNRYYSMYINICHFIDKRRK